MRISILISFNTVHFAFMKVYTKLENTGSNRSREICYRNFHWRERNKQIKGLISNMWLFFVTQYNSSLSSFVPNFKILTQVVAEKSLTKKKFTDRLTDKQADKHNYRKGKNYIPPIFVQGGGIINTNLASQSDKISSTVRVEMYKNSAMEKFKM